jgi:hypothetical protein
MSSRTAEATCSWHAETRVGASYRVVSGDWHLPGILLVVGQVSTVPGDRSGRRAVEESQAEIAGLVKHLAAGPGAVDEAAAAEDGKVLGDRRGGDVQRAGEHGGARGTAERLQQS